MSIPDLKQIIIEKLEKKFGIPLDSEICIPSDEYIRLQFWPGNSFTNIATKYTGRFNIVYKVQSRQLSKFHLDAYYCAALFRYTRLFAIKFKDYLSFICADDKHKVPIGEGIATSSGVRNKKSLVPIGTELGSSDHDFTKFSLTPSVMLFCDIPNDISETFYRGQVYVSYKDTTFQPSSAIRHASEFYNTLMQYYDINLPEILLLYTDGGPDHRTTFGSVQISLICLFLQGDFDFLASVRTAPYHSWTNPAERVMSILNLALQGVSLERDKMDNVLEEILKGKNTLEEIRVAANKNDLLRIKLIDSIKPVQKLLNERTSRLSLDGKKFLTKRPDFRFQIDEMFEVTLYNLI